MACYEIRYDDGRVEEDINIRGLYYMFPDQSELEVITEIGWCFNCDELTDLEHLETISEVDSRIADMQDPRSVLGKILGGEFLHLHIADDYRRREFLMQRQEPPKCIHCGSDDIRSIPHGEPVPHPTENGTLTITCVAMCSTSFQNWYYTPQGDRIHKNMDESEWLISTDPVPMLEFIGQKVSGRKLRLFACACCRLVWDDLDRTGRNAVDTGEWYADGLVDKQEARKAGNKVRQTNGAHDPASRAACASLGSMPHARVCAILSHSRTE